MPNLTECMQRSEPLKCLSRHENCEVPSHTSILWIIHLSNYRVICGSDFVKYSVIDLQRLRQLEGDLLFLRDIIVAKRPTETPEQNKEEEYRMGIKFS